MIEIEHDLGEDATSGGHGSLVRGLIGPERRSLSRVRSRWLWVGGQLALAVALVFLYFRVRGLTEASPAVAFENAAEVIAVEQWLGIDGALGLQHQLQQVLLDVPFAVTLANWVYIWAHWPVIIVSATWLAVRRPDVFRQLRDAMVISGGVGMVIFALFPLAPPRLFDAALVDTVSEQSVAYRLLQPPAFVNQYAAMPSLHAGWDLLVGMALFTAASGIVLRVVGCVLPVLMAVSVVATANHYVLDVVAGLSLVLVAHAIAVRLERRRSLGSFPAPLGATQRA